MSTVAASRVDVKIAVDAQGNASRVVKQTRDELDAMGKSAQAATGNAATGMARYSQLAQQSASKIGGAFSAVNAVLGGTNPIMQKLGQSFTAAGAVANVIPGPIGIAAAAMTGLAVATYKFIEAANEAEAKTKFMRGGAGSEGMAAQLGITQDAAIKVGAALEQMTDQGIRPTSTELRAVRDRAVAMGADGSKAVEQYLAAWAKGPDALIAVQAEIGNLGIKNLGELGASIGLSRESLGLERDLTDLKVQQDELLKEAAQIQASVALAGGKITETDQRSLDLVRQKAKVLEGELAARRRYAAEEKVSLQNSTLAKGRATLLDIAATQEKRKTVAEVIRIQAIDLRLADIAARLNTLHRNRNVLSQQDYAIKVQALKIEQAQAEAAKAAVFDQAQADRAARQQAAAAKNKERIQAETDATIKLAQAEVQLATERAKVPGADPDVLAARLRVIDLEEAAARKAAKDRTNTARGRENELRAIELNARNEREAARKATADAEVERSRKVVELKRAAFEEELQAEIDTQAKIDELSKAQAAREIEQLRNRGDVHGATMLEIQTAEAQTAANIEKINRDLAIKLTGIDEQSELAAKERLLADQQIAAERQKLADVTAAAFTKESDAIVASFKTKLSTVDDAIQNTLGASADLVQSGFARTVEAKQNAIEALKALQENSANLNEADRADLDAQVKAQEKIYQKQIKGLQDQAKQAQETIKSVQSFGKGIAGIVGNVQKGSQALAAFQKAADAGNVEQMATANEGLTNAIDGTIAASGAAATAFIEDEQTKAAILAITETAASVAAFAGGNIPGGIAHAASAAIYAGVAGGAIPTGGAGTAGTATAGATTGGGGAVTGATGEAGGGGGGVTQVFNFNKGFVVGSTQEVAKGISGTLRSVNGTGYDRRKAA